MSYIQDTIYFAANQNIAIAEQMRSTLVSAGCTLVDSTTLRAGNSDHYLKVYHNSGNSTEVIIELLKIDGTTIAVTSTQSYINNVTFAIKCVYSANGFGVRFIGAGSFGIGAVEIMALKMIDPDDMESWAVALDDDLFYTNGIDVPSVSTNQNVVNKSVGTWDWSASFMYRSDSSKLFTGKPRAVAGSDGLGALNNGGIANSSIMKLDSSYYLWLGSNAVYITDRAW